MSSFNLLYICKSQFKIFLFVLGLCFISSGIATFFSISSIVQSKIKENMVIKNGSNGYKFWLDPPAKIHRKMYLFNITNPKDVQKGRRPKLVEMGPYTYSQKWEKRNIKFFGPNVISFTPVVTLKFEPSLSNGLETDLITFLNIPALGVIENSSGFGYTMLNLLLKDTKLFETKTVGELISGYTDRLMELGKQYNPDKIKDDKFSLLNGRNGTEWQSYKMMTGNDDVLNIAKIISWNGKEKVDIWSSDQANMINGTDGTLYPPFLDRNKRLYSFSPDMCRSFYLAYERDNYIDGIETYDFHLPKTTFDFSNPENSGFSKGNIGNGAQNISTCYGGISSFLSQPHFLNADKKFIDNLDGLEPNIQIHDSKIHFQPTISTPLEGNIRLQINFYLPRNDKINLVKRVKPVLLPMIWFDESFELNSDAKEEIKKMIFYMRISPYMYLIPISFGVLTLSVVLFLSLKNILAKKKSMKIKVIKEKKESQVDLLEAAISA